MDGSQWGRRICAQRAHTLSNLTVALASARCPLAHPLTVATRALHLLVLPATRVQALAIGRLPLPFPTASPSTSITKHSASSSSQAPHAQVRTTRGPHLSPLRPYRPPYRPW